MNAPATPPPPPNNAAYDTTPPPNVPRATSSPSMGDLENIVIQHSNRFRLVLEVYEPLIMRPSGRVKGTGTYKKVRKGAMRFTVRDWEELRDTMELVMGMVNGRTDD